MVENYYLHGLRESGHGRQQLFEAEFRIDEADAAVGVPEYISDLPGPRVGGYWNVYRPDGRHGQRRDAPFDPVVRVYRYSVRPFDSD